NRNSELEVCCSRLGHSTGFTLTMEMPRSRKTVKEAVQLGLVDDATRERALVSVGVELELFKALANAGPKGARAEVANRGSRGQRRRWRAGETQGQAEDECDRRRDQRHREEASGEGGETQDSAERGDRGETGVTVEDANRRDDREYVDGDEQGRGRANQVGRSADSGQQSEQDSPGDHGDRDEGAPRHTSAPAPRKPGRQYAVGRQRCGQLRRAAKVDVHRAHGQRDREDRARIATRSSEPDRDQVGERDSGSGSGWYTD